MYLIELAVDHQSEMLHYKSSTEPVVKYNERGDIIGMDWSPIDKRDKHVFFNWRYVMFITYKEIRTDIPVAPSNNLTELV